MPTLGRKLIPSQEGSGKWRSCCGHPPSVMLGVKRQGRHFGQILFEWFCGFLGFLEKWDRFGIGKTNGRTGTHIVGATVLGRPSV